MNRFSVVIGLCLIVTLFILVGVPRILVYRNYRPPSHSYTGQRYTSSELNVFSDNLANEVSVVLDSLGQTDAFTVRLLSWSYDDLWDDVRMQMEWSHMNPKHILKPLPTKQEIHNHILRFIPRRR